MKEEKYTKSVEVFNGSLWEAEVIKGLLKSHGVPCVIQDGNLGAIAPYIDPQVSLLVTEDQYETANKIIESNKEKDND
ncbi:DUF2007-related protein [Bacteroides pyogenes]|uniref:DUF2007 domain-containing protein n=2 Tax=Bacteroides pyogenes TaxID=310300 RepID=W4PK02_9BACE|nr:DUF2007-related protein [Bacteroides pyogenes]GAE16302.1 hypothetical protein JCM6292_2710 [Bacteroides pyogenes JCM 6292]MBR8708441.1 hypothetical protein [Bacteroides pyogenes]MBR8717037.1 hypothetical protein [Bacteroides pyogenes]MBR8746812.1 hypothetical protein [Bacteroides pyogenes]MBR8757021.1 hypothetical protein [Bacteroides pyogenes]